MKIRFVGGKHGGLSGARRFHKWLEMLFIPHEYMEDAGGVRGFSDKSSDQLEEAFRELKSYLEVRPIHHRRPDRVINHVRLCFLAYWMSSRLGREWREKGEKEEVPWAWR